MQSDDVSNRTLYCSNLPDQITEELLYELFLQAGPVDTVKIPKDNDGRFRRFGFVEFKHGVSIPYSIELMKGASLFGKELRIKPRHGSTAHSTPQQPQQDNQFHRSVSAPDMANVNSPSSCTPWMNSNFQQQAMAAQMMAMQTMQQVQQVNGLMVSPSYGVPMGQMQRNDTLNVQSLLGTPAFSPSIYGTPSPNYMRNDSRNLSGANTSDVCFANTQGSYSQRSYVAPSQDRHHRRDYSQDRSRPYQDNSQHSHRQSGGGSHDSHHRHSGHRHH